MINPPVGFGAQEWNERWDRMQERYTVRRAERFDTILRLIAAAQPTLSRAVDLGCGPGSLAERILGAFPQTEVIGIDSDATLLLLAKGRLAKFGKRAHLIEADLRKPALRVAGSPASAGKPLRLAGGSAQVDAAVSSTALHWLSEKKLTALYRQVARLLRPGGIFLNADHVGSDNAAIQESWRNHKKEMLSRESPAASDDWMGFWEGYARALGLDSDKMPWRTLVVGGVEQGLPLAWHMDTLRKCGFTSVDCFWRCDGDAIYGGVRAPRKRKMVR